MKKAIVTFLAVMLLVVVTTMPVLAGHPTGPGDAPGGCGEALEVAAQESGRTLPVPECPGPGIP